MSEAPGITLSWTGPAPISTLGQEGVRRLGGLLLKVYFGCVGLLALPALAVVAVRAPDQLGHALLVLSVVGIAYPLALATGLRASLRTGARYAIEEEGLRFGAGSLRIYPWAQVVAYRLEATREGGPRQLEFRLSGAKSWQGWAFDPTMVDEGAIREAMERHLPGLAVGC